MWRLEMARERRRRRTIASRVGFILNLQKYDVVSSGFSH